MKNRSILWFFVLIGLLAESIAQEECKLGGCFPATGDLLVGRERNITASSTCGLKSPEKYCIVSFLERNDKCFICQSNKEVDDTPQGYQHSHLPKYMVTSSPQDRLKGWWQSENGKQEVTISIDLEAEFVFTHLIMTFKTFRPKAMYIERSWNYGRDWSVYRYFAYDCKKSFPGISRGPQKKIDDVICEERYSKVEPSTEGEVVMKVLDPVIQQKEDPYSLKVQNLLKLTNLRIRLTELHTFGDDVLGDNPEVNQKYYYALYEMVVRGSCSCYGHAEKCIPTDKTPSNANMVHGKCQCTHFTTGLNCERCMEGYNDEPWKPAYKDQLHECKKCNCNGHTNKCHFDPAVYIATGNSSGGVCDDCQHNTAGRQCEQCKALYYRDPFKNIFDPDVCKPCDCDPSGSFGGGECETVTSNVGGESGTVAGRCICKQNAVGSRCDKCQDGYWNLLESNPNGCQSCNCDDRGTVSSDKCDQQTGSCRCKRYVKGLTCSKCSDGYWALGTTPEGCKPCDCSPGGSKNLTCDDVSGMCQCRQYLTGRKCDQVRPGYYFENPDSDVKETEDTHGSSTSTYISRRIFGGKDEVVFTGDGYLQVQQGSIVRYENIDVPYSGRYSIVFRYDNDNYGDWDDIRITISKKNGGKLGETYCAPFEATEQTIRTTLPRDQLAKTVAQSVCLEKGVDYNVKIDFRSNNGRGNVQTYIDSIVLMPDGDDLEIFKGRNGDQLKKLYEECKKYYLKPGDAKNAPQKCKDLQFSISSERNNGGLSCSCDPTGTLPSGNSEILICEAAGGQCPCKPGVVGRRCDRCASGYFGFGPNGCTACDCSSVGSTSLFCDESTGECPCKPQLEGRKCDSCPVNHYGFPNCKPCQCSGHSDTCDRVTGECINCRHNTDGYNCHKCAEGYYGDATKGTDSDCQRCQCPGGSSTNQFSKTCRLQGDGKVICDNCIEGYTGDQCEKCTDGYYGNPVKSGGSCQKCDCNGNIDSFADGKCDPTTGVCKNCINNAAGDQCERCKDGFFGNAKNQTCRACVCNSLGTDPNKGVCNHRSGQCPCLPNVEGLQCDVCSPGYYNLASGNGCEPCNCDKDGSLEGSCNQMDGQCRCRVGFGGRNCSECEDFSWGNPKEENGCKACGCNPVGSKSLQCDRSTGVCPCNDNVIGDKCDMCAPRTSGIMPKCEDCHTCNDQWEDIVNLLEKNITNLMKLKGNYTFNTTELGLYSREIKALKDLLDMIENMLKGRSVDAAEVDQLRERLDKFRTELMDLDSDADKYVEMVSNTTTRNKNANDELDNLNLRFIKLRNDTEMLKKNLTEMIESNVGGALNSTRDSLRRSRAAEQSVNTSSTKLKESKKLRKKIKKEIIKGDPTFEDLDQENQELISNLTNKISDLENKLKELNGRLCGGGSDCGGCSASGCDTCVAAGSNCSGVKQQTQEALTKAVEAKQKLLAKKAQAEIMLADIKMAEQAVNESKAAAEKAEQSSKDAKKIGEEVLENITTLIKDINDFLSEEFKHPNVSKALAIETLGLNISLTPEEVKKLAKEINETFIGLENVEKILNESQKDHEDAKNLKEEALRARDYALAVMNKTDRILGMLVKATELQNTTAAMISVARADIESAEKLIAELTQKLDSIDGDLNKAATDTDDLESKRDRVNETFIMNREKLQEAENEAKTAVDLANKVNETSNNLNEKYDQAKQKLNEKLNITDDILKRVEKLSKGAVDLFADTLVKLNLIDELKRKFLRNEMRVEGLRDKLKRLEILAESKRDKIHQMSKCYVGCNPNEDVICTNDLALLDASEKSKLEAHQAMVDRRKETTS